jgi:hypothetical protein
MNKIVITGEPQSGITALFEGLRSYYPEAKFIPNPEEVIKKDKPNLPDGFVFGKMLIAQALKDKISIPKDTILAIQDTGLLEAIIYARANHCEELIPRTIPLIHAARYTLALYCCAAQNQDTDNEVAKDYDEFKIPLIELPQQNRENRILQAKQLIDNHLGN